MSLADEWIRSTSIAWLSAEAGDYAKALRCYQYSDELAQQSSYSIFMNSELSLLRHKEGHAHGYVSPLAPSEDVVLSLEVGYENYEHVDSRGMNQTPIDIDLSQYQADIPDYVSSNLNKELPHIMALSTGRCGTVSLYHLMEKTNYIPYHTYFFAVPSTVRYEMMCRMIENSPNGEPERQWIKTRLAEWIGGENLERPIFGMNHLDTIFAPLFAQIHPKSKFIYLHRDSEKVFKSFYTKDQWSDNQLCALNYKFEPFQWRRAGFDKPKSIAWFIKFTENFSRSLGNTLGDRFIEISADKLFAQDLTEIMRFIEFTETDLLPNDLVNHYSNVYNEKAHKITMTDIQAEKGLEVFRREYAALC